MSIEHFPVFDCAKLACVSISFRRSRMPGERKRREYRGTPGLDVEQPTCLSCVIGMVKTIAAEDATK